MKLRPFHTESEAEMLRGSLHAHTNVSDGDLSPEALLDAYRAQGYDFVAITDHFRSEFAFPVTDGTPWAKDLTLIPSAELHHGLTSTGWLWHFTANGLPVDFEPPREEETTSDLVRRAVEAGAFVSIVHPGWYQLTLEDADGPLELAHAVEIYNAGCQAMHDRGDGAYLVDGLLDRGRRVLLTAVDDTHGHLPDLGLAWVNVHAKDRSATSVVEALKVGDFYSSQGPEIKALEFDVDTHRLRIRTTAAKTILVNGQGYANAFCTGVNITKAEIDLSPLGDSPWFRVTVVAQDGRRAWTNPYWFDELR